MTGADEPGTDAGRGRLGLWLLLANLVIVGLIAALAGLSLHSARQALQQRAQVAADNLAETLQRHIDAELLQIDTALRNVIVQLRLAGPVRAADASFVDAVLAAQLELAPKLDSLRIADAGGAVRLGRGVPAASTLNLADRDFFRRARDEAQAGLLISGPFVARVSGKWVLALARRLDDVDGRFAGVVYANVATDHFQQMFASVDVGARGAVTLRSRSLALVARHAPGQAGGAPVGSTAVSAELSRALQAEPRRGSFVATTAIDQVERINAYRQVGEHPLIVLVGFDTSTHFGPWRAQVAQIAALVGLVLAVLAGSSWVVHRAWRRAADDARALLREGRRTHALLRTASDGIHVLDREGRLVELSDSFAAMLGSDRESLIGRHVSSWDARLDAQAIDRWLAAFGFGQRQRFETRHRRADGSFIDVEVHCAGVRIDGRDLVYCSSRDITQLHRAHEQLDRVTREQQAMLDNRLVGIAKFRDRRIVWKNRAIDRIFGYEPDELLGQPTQLLHVDDASFDAEGAAAYPVLQRGGRYRTQLRMQRKDGRQVWIDANGVMISPESDESLWMLVDITPIKQAQEQVEHIAFHDALTGLPNRVLLVDRLRQALALAARSRRLVAVCYLDLDGFKPVNDELGHAAGDRLLQEVARRLLSVLRGNDTVSRLGGDEFVIVMAQLDSLHECTQVLERVLAAMSQPLPVGGEQRARVSASIGVAVFPHDGEQPDMLLGHADQAMYRAKKAGRNRVQFYSDGFTSSHSPSQ